MPAQFASGPYHRLLIFLLVMTGAVSAHAQQWRQFPPTPDLPKPDRTGIAAVNGVRIWYAVFGHGSPVIMVHGGAGSSKYWGYRFRHLHGNTKSSCLIAVVTAGAPVTTNQSRIT